MVSESNVVGSRLKGPLHVMIVVACEAGRRSTRATLVTRRPNPSMPPIATTENSAVRASANCDGHDVSSLGVLTVARGPLRYCACDWPGAAHVPSRAERRRCSPMISVYAIAMQWVQVSTAPTTAIAEFCAHNIYTLNSESGRNPLRFVSSAVECSY